MVPRSKRGIVPRCRWKGMPRSRRKGHQGAGGFAWCSSRVQVGCAVGLPCFVARQHQLKALQLGGLRWSWGRQPRCWWFVSRVWDHGAVHPFDCRWWCCRHSDAGTRASLLPFLFGVRDDLLAPAVQRFLVAALQCHVVGGPLTVGETVRPKVPGCHAWP